jgi:acyl-CoA synthetase (AMP-forming)/AMP-acid ligase II
MPGVFGDHQLELPYSPLADLLARYRRREPDKTAIVDLDQGSRITFGALDRVASDIGAYLKSRGIGKGSRVLLLSDECLEKLLIWLGTWRIGAVICPLNIEIARNQLAEVTATLDPALILHHKEIDCDALVGKARAPRLRFGTWSDAGESDPADEFFAIKRRTMPASSAPPAPLRAPRSFSTTTRHTGSTGSTRSPFSVSARTTARSNIVHSAGTRRRC